MDKERLKDEFIRQINIPSVSGNEEQFSLYLESQLRELSLKVERDSLGNLFARLEGEIPHKRPLLLCAHLDTVPTDPIKFKLEGETIKADGSAILGADDKAATAALMETLRSLKEEGIKHGDLEVLLTVQEEVGLVGAKHFDLSKTRSHLFYVLDYSGPIGLGVRSAPYANDFRFRFFGKAAHAGGEPEKGISAIQAMALAIANMPLGRIDFETTANIGIVSGGKATNIVADLAEMRGEARSRSLEKLEKQTGLMIQAAEEAALSVGAKLEVECVREYDGYFIEEDEEIVLLAQEAAKALGIDFRLVDAGGASDANVFSSRGKKALVLSCGYLHPHTPEEEVSLREMFQLCRFLTELIQRA